MQYVNKYDKDGKCSKTGFMAETTFADLAHHRGWEVTKTSKSVDMYRHIDFDLKKSSSDSWEKQTDHMLVDVKSRKKTSRKDSRFNDDWIWLEFKNVQGKNGWMLGSSTHIVFERENEFVLVPRQELLTWAKQAIADHNGGEITVKCKAKNAKDARYKYYTRWNRNDLLTQVNYEDMIQSVKNVEIWKK